MRFGMGDDGTYLKIWRWNASGFFSVVYSAMGVALGIIGDGSAAAVSLAVAAPWFFCWCAERNAEELWASRRVYLDQRNEWRKRALASDGHGSHPISEVGP